MRDGDPVHLRSASLFWLFGWYLRYFFWRRFHAIRLSRSGLPAATSDRPIIVYSNHPSWWDPALYIILQTKLFPGRRGFGPMDAAALRKYGFMRRLGIFGIELDAPRGAARFLRTSLALLSDPRHVLWITAEGAFTDPRARPLRLRPGVAHLARHIPDAVILPLAIEYTFWNESSPEALARFGSPIASGRERTLGEWQETLENALTATMDVLAAESMARNPGLFTPLLRGLTGIGGFYDAQRRLKALLAGRRFDPTHGGEEPGE